MHPLDFEALHKGDIIGQTQIEAATNVRHSDDPDRYRIEVLQLARAIDDRRRDLVTKIDHRSIRILVDVEIGGYCKDRFEKDLRSMRRNVGLVGRVDRSNLTELEVRKVECLGNHIARAAIEADRVARDARRGLRELEAAPEKGELPSGD